MIGKSSRYLGFYRQLPSKPIVQLPPPVDIFDPNEFPVSSHDEVEEVEVESTTKQKKNAKAAVMSEGRQDGFAPTKTALSVLLQGLQSTSRLDTSLSDTAVTLFNFHSTTFAERLLGRNIRSVVCVENSQAFSKAAKKFATSQRQNFRNVDAYRADIATLMGIGRKKVKKLPTKLLFAGDLPKDVAPLVLRNDESEESRTNVPSPTLLAVLPTENAQKAIVDAFMQHLLCHHAKMDNDTIFGYGETRFFTFLSCRLAVNLHCSNDPRLSFLSHQLRRTSDLFNKLFHFSFLHTKQEQDGYIRPVGHPSTSFHPNLPKTNKIAHEKKLEELHLCNNMFYAVSIRPRTHIVLGNRTVCDEIRPDSDDLETKEILPFSFYMSLIARESNSKPASNVFSNLWPESSKAMISQLGDAKIGTVSSDDIEHGFLEIRHELHDSEQFQTFKKKLHIKREYL